MQSSLKLCLGGLFALVGHQVLAIAQEPRPPTVPPRSAAAVAADLEVASYTLRARLDADAHTIQGSGSIRWTNASTEPTTELWLHLYLNAFKNDQTLFLRSPFGAGRSGARAAEWGYIDVTKLSVRQFGSQNLWPQAEPHSPNDPLDQTDIRVPLPELVSPFETIVLDLEFTAKLPQIVERTGYSGSYHFAGQWFPKLARRERDGTWAHFAFHPQSEFYSDFGAYDVTMDVPQAMVLGASGARVEERVSGGRRISRYRISPAHDFAWVAWDGFRELHQKIRGVEVTLLHPAGYDSSARATFDALEIALPRFETLYGRYPYPSLTVVYPPAAAAASGGMEYPGLITTGGRWFYPLLGLRAVESVTVHELGHQWFYGVLATDEHSWPFLDEGLNSYAELDLLTSRFGASSAWSFGGLQVSSRSLHRAFAAARALDEPVAQPAQSFASFRSLASLVYSRTATALDTLGRVYGEERLRQALRDYAARHRFGHPTPQDLLTAVREGVGVEAARNLAAALFDRAWVDYLVDDIQSVKGLRPAGVFDGQTGRVHLKPPPGAPDEQWMGRVVVLRRGTLELPVDVDLIYEDGSRQRHQWDGHGTWTTFDYRGPNRLIGAIIDPDHQVTLDQNLLNNAASLSANRTGRFFERAVYFAQLLLSSVGP